MRLTVSLWRLCLMILAGLAWPKAAPGAANDMAGAAIRYHCAGIAQLTANSNLVILNKAFGLRPGVALEKLAMERISRLLAGGLNLGTNASAASLLEPLLKDAFESESMGSFGGTAAHPLNFVLAVHVDAARAQLWRDNLDKAFGRPAEKFAAGEFNGWRWNRGASDSCWIMPDGDWLVAGRGDEFTSLQTEYLQQVKQQGRPAPSLQDKWLDADLDWTHPSACVPEWARLFKPARVKFNVAVEQDHLRVMGRVIYPEALPWKSVPWQIPTELAGGPLVSFTAGQNIAACLNLGPNFSQLDGNPLTNQFCAWAVNPMPFLTYMAWPETDATNVLQELSTEASSYFSPELMQFNGTELDWQEKEKKLVLSNLRVITPSLQAAREKAGEYLLAGFFAPTRPQQAVPDELLQQVNGRTNLVYYDWEQTGPRSQHWQMLGLMLLTKSREPTDYVLDARRLEDRWLNSLARLPGNTTTEVTRAAPNELAVVRTGPLGFTAIEMFLLTDWLSAAGAPPINPLPAAH